MRSFHNTVTYFPELQWLNSFLYFAPNVRPVQGSVPHGLRFGPVASVPLVRSVRVFLSLYTNYVHQCFDSGIVRAIYTGMPPKQNCSQELNASRTRPPSFATSRPRLEGIVKSIHASDPRQGAATCFDMTSARYLHHHAATSHKTGRLSAH